MADAESKFRDHVLQIQEYASLSLSEADTRAYLIDPMLRILGYDGIHDLRREVTVPATKEAVDYQLMVDGQPQVIVEAKALRNPPTDQHAAQCVQYATILGVRWCLITNGLRWAVYDAQGKGPLTEKRVAGVALDGDLQNTDDAWAVLSSFSQDALAQATPLTNLLVERVVADELGRPDSRAVEALRKVVAARFGERVSGPVVVAAIQQVISKLGTMETGAKQVFQPDSPGGAQQQIAVETSSSGVRQRSEAAKKAWETRRQNCPQTTVRPPSSRITIANLVEAGILPSDATVTATIRGATHIAIIQNGNLKIGDQVYSTPSAASKAVRNVRSWNGWNDWHYAGKSLQELRGQMGEASELPPTAE